MKKYVPLYVVRNLQTGALYTQVPVDGPTASDMLPRIWDVNGWSAIDFVGYGIPYVGVFRR